MVLHLGQSVKIPEEEILGIFDLDKASWAFKTREFLERAEKENRVVTVGEELPLSLILTRGGEKGPKVYISQLSPAALLGRLERDSLEEL